MKVISFVDYQMAYSNWAEYHGHVHNNGPLHENFLKTFGINSMYCITWVDDTHQLLKVSNQCDRMVRLFSGPHWRTLVRAYEVRHDKI